jgi:hypothetical protein
MTRESANRAPWTEACTWQIDRVKVLEPLAVGEVRFASRPIRHVRCVDREDIEAATLQNLTDRKQAVSYSCIDVISP